MILGTAAYMSPEQARGKTVDKRADIWAFGVVLYEMLTGATLFGAARRSSDTLAAVLTRDPDWTALPPDTPPRIRRLMERCLDRDRKRRLADIADARLDIDEALSGLEFPAPAAALHARAAFRWWNAAVALVALAGLALAVVHFREDTAATRRRALPDCGTRKSRFRQHGHGAVARWPPTGFHCQRRRSAPDAMGPPARFRYGARSARHRRRGLSSVLVARQPFYRISGAGEGQEDRCRRRLSSNPLRGSRRSGRRFVEP